MPKHFNDIGFPAFSGLAELMGQWSYRAEQSAAFFPPLRLEGKTRRKGAEKEWKEKILRSQIRDVLGLLRDSLIILHFEQKQ